MGRPQRVDVAGYAYHVLNRSVGRQKLFHRDEDFAAFERVLAASLWRASEDVRLLAYCIMPNHWHLVVHTTRDGALSPFMKWLTLTHTQRYRVAHRNVGDGPVYQGRFKSFVIESEQHLLTVCRYVERNALRAGLVERAEDWRWGSLWRWRHPRKNDSGKVAEDDSALQLSPWPLLRGTVRMKDGSGRPRHWLRTVNAPLSADELAKLRTSAQRGRPYGDARWVKRMVARYELESTLRGPGRPRGDDD